MSAVMEREFTLNINQAARLLDLHVGEIESGWQKEIQRLNLNLKNRLKRDDVSFEVKNAIACAILAQEKVGLKIFPPLTDALHKWHTWSQCKDRTDWIQLLQERIDHDNQIESWRNQCLSLGVVDPIEYSPATRQAYNWLFTKAEESGVVTPETKKDIARRFRNLVLAYGGNVICYLFMKEEWKINRKVLNWRTNYFFERLIFDTYSFEQVYKIKKQELMKTNSKLVKSLIVNKEA